VFRTTSTAKPDLHEHQSSLTRRSRLPTGYLHGRISVSRAPVKSQLAVPGASWFAGSTPRFPTTASVLGPVPPATGSPSREAGEPSSRISSASRIALVSARDLPPPMSVQRDQIVVAVAPTLSTTRSHCQDVTASICHVNLGVDDLELCPALRDAWLTAHVVFAWGG